MSRKKNVIPDYESVTPFLKGQASKIFKEVVDQDKVLIVQKQNKPQNVIISYGFEKCKQFFTELFLSHMLGVNLDFERSSHAK